MFRKSLRTLAGAMAGFVCAIGIAGLTFRAQASRNSSGTYALPSGNPVVSGQPISSTWANNTLNDLATEVTNSLDRQGRGGMLAPLRVADGSVTAPSYAFTNETSTGLYRIGASSIGMSVNGSKVANWTAAGEAITGTLNVSGATTLAALTTAGICTNTAAGLLGTVAVVPVANGGTGSATQNFVDLSTAQSVGGAKNFTGGLGSGIAPVFPLDVAPNANGMAARFGNAGLSLAIETRASIGARLAGNASFNGAGDIYNATGFAGLLEAPGAAGDWVFYNSPSGTAGTATNMVEQFRVKQTGGVSIGGGAAISASYRGTVSWTPGSIAAGASTSIAITIASASPGTECAYGFDDAAPAANNNLLLVPSCSVDHSGHCNIRLFNPGAAAVTGYAGTYACRVFNP